MSSYLINACMRQSPTPDSVVRKDFASVAVTSHAPPGNDVMYRSDAYYNSQLYPTSRVPPNVAGFGMHEKLMGGGGGGGSVFQPHAGFGDPGSPMAYSAGGLHYKPTASLHNGLRPHHDATTTALTHRPPSAAPVSATVLADEKSPAALSPPLSSSPGSSPPLAETDQGAGSGSAGGSDAAVTAGDDSTTSQQQQQQQSPTEPLIYPWMRRVHSGHGGKNNNNLSIFICLHNNNVGLM